MRGIIFPAQELIDTLWNVNVTLVVAGVAALTELIDTLWNVNTVMSGRKSTEVSELIETYWNVDYYHN